MEVAWEQRRPLLRSLSFKASQYHDKIPLVRKLPKESVVAIGSLIVVNAIVWAAAGIVLSYHSPLVSTAVLSYVLGLRHALDADHISAIDLMTRRLIASGKPAATVGMFFSLGHSTIVIVTSIVVAATANAISNKFDSFTRTGNIIGSSVSAAFLILLGAINVYILYTLVRTMQREVKRPRGEEDDLDENGNPSGGPLDFESNNTGGCMFGLLKRVFKLVDRPWKMYPVGVLFGLGFDTSSEIAILGISSIQATQGTSIWIIMIFPILFTAGMCLLDTTDGALMMALYTKSSAAQDTVMILYYSIVLTAVTVLVALVIGTLQLLTLVDKVAEPTGSFWEGVEVAGENYDIIGGAICGSFVFFGIVSFLLYKPWRRRVEAARPDPIDDEAIVGDADDGAIHTEPVAEFPLTNAARSATKTSASQQAMET